MSSSNLIRLSGLAAVVAGLLIGAVVGFLPIPLTELVLNVAVVWLGLTLLSRRGASDAPATAGAQPRVQ